MKKFVAAAAAVMMAFAMSVTAFAAGSVGSEGTIEDPSTGTMDTIYGNEVRDGEFGIYVHPDAEVKVEAYEPAKREELEKSLNDAVKNDAALREQVKNLGLDPDVFHVEAIYNVERKEGEGKATFAFVTDSKYGVGEKIVALHQKADGTWEAIEVKDGAEGGYYIELDSFSPVAFIWGIDTGYAGEEEPKTEEAKKEEAKADENTSPKTGDLGAVALIKSVF